MTTAIVLDAIKNMTALQYPTARPIGIDTLILVLRISANDLMPLIEELQENQEIFIHEAKSLQTKGKTTGSVSLY